IFAQPTNTIRFAEVPKLNVRVDRGMSHDGLGKYVGTKVKKAQGAAADNVKLLRDTGTDVVVNYMPVGSEMATKWYVEQVLDAGCAFVNCIPVFIASQPYWARRFAERKLPLIGDDVKSQVGSTIVHRVLTALPRARRAARSDLSAQLRRQHGLLQHAGARAAGVQEDIENRGGDQPARLCLAGGGDPRRAERLRAVADRPQVGLHPAGGHDLRQCAAERRGQDGGLGQPEQRGGGDRRGALRPACA